LDAPPAATGSSGPAVSNGRPIFASRCRELVNGHLSMRAGAIGRHGRIGQNFQRLRPLSFAWPRNSRPLSLSFNGDRPVMAIVQASGAWVSAGEPKPALAQCLSDPLSLS